MATVPRARAARVALVRQPGAMQTQVADILVQHSRWMAWNAVLALVPLALAQGLFTRPRRRTAVWWAGLVAFVLFLPNAPYVLTDVIHLFEDVRRIGSDRAVLFVLVPVYAGLFVVGFGSYVLSIRHLLRWLRGLGVGRAHIVVAITAVHLLSAFGVDVGRFQRFNSWDALVRPLTLVAGFAQSLSHPLRVAVTFIVIAVLYASARVVMLGLRTWWTEQHANWRHGLT